MSPSVEQNDPTELLEVFDAQGRPTGRARSRAAVHLDGDWHQAFHCWIVRPGRTGTPGDPHGWPGNPAEVVLQRRSQRKDTFPGRWDAAAAGHWRFGETAEQAAREIAEELGLSIPFDRLQYRGRESEDRAFANGLIDREHHQVYRLEWPAPLASYRPDPGEVIGLAALPAIGLLELVASQRRRLEATEAVSVSPSGQLLPAEVVLERADLVPYSLARLERLLGPGPGRSLQSGRYG